MAKVFPIQVNYNTPEKRKEMKMFCKEHFGRSFSEQCRFMLQAAKREADEAKKARQQRPADG